ncbi:MAG: xylulokinase [Actinobacteria bacterium]|nr:xylulokinase [Actinomycetota bacterium]
MKFLIGMDIGTSSTRAIIIDQDGKLIASATADYPLITPKPGWAEQDPEDWWQASVKVIKEVICASGINPYDIAAIGPSGQMHGSVFLDRKKNVLRPALLWCDQRTQKQCDQIYDIFGYEGFIKLSYNKALTGFTAPKILWLRENEPENYKRLFKILLPKDYIRFKLSGTFATEVSDASGTVLMDIAKRRWSDDILNGLNIDRNLLPDIFESDVISAKVSSAAASLTGLIEGTPLVGGAGDQAGGAVGSGIVTPGLISDYLGTSGVVFSYSDSPVYDSQGRLHSFCHAVNGKWHLMGVTLSAAGSLKWYDDKFGPSDEIKKQYAEIKGYKLLDMQAERISPGAEGLIFLPYLSGERTPYADPFARGVFFGLSYIHGQDHFVRAILEGVAFSQYDCLRLMGETGIKSDKVILFGGGAKSKLWKQITADIFNTEIVTLNVEEGPSYGGALLAAVGSGIYSSVADAAKKVIKEKDRVLPVAENVEKYKKIYEIYKSLYAGLKNDFSKLGRIF